MKSHILTIIASGMDVGSLESIDRFFEAGCDDATVSVQKGLFVVEFDRESDSFEHAVIGAIQDVKRAGAVVERVEPDYLVNASDIASRAGMTRAAVSLYASGKRGEGFPAPVARVTTDSPLWDWVEVAEWLAQEKKLSEEAVKEAFVLRGVNRAIVQSHMKLTDTERDLEAALAVA